MADITISGKLAEQLQRVAQDHNRSVESIVEQLLAQSEFALEPQQKDESSSLEDDTRYQAARKTLMLRVYEQAREYWRQVGDNERLALTDEQLDEVFWLIDHEGIPRFKSEQGKVEFPSNSSYWLAKAIENYTFRSGHADIAERSREILDSEFADDLLRRMNGQTEDED